MTKCPAFPGHISVVYTRLGQRHAFCIDEGLLPALPYVLVALKRFKLGRLERVSRSRASRYSGMCYRFEARTNKAEPHKAHVLFLSPVRERSRFLDTLAHELAHMRHYEGVSCDDHTKAHARLTKQILRCWRRVFSA